MNRLARTTTTTKTTTTITTTTTATTSSALKMANDEDLLRWARASRSAGSEDTVVELIRPLGLVLNEDQFKNVYVETVAPKGNAARTGKVREKREKYAPIDVFINK
jgi:hypothetical protein